MKLQTIIKSAEQHLRRYDERNIFNFESRAIYTLYFHDQADGTYGNLNKIDFDVAKPTDISIYYLVPQAISRFQQLLRITTMNAQAALAAVASLAYFCDGRIITRPRHLSMPTTIDLLSGSAASRHKCTCPIRDLMIRGCTCGGV